MSLVRAVRVDGLPMDPAPATHQVSANQLSANQLSGSVKARKALDRAARGLAPALQGAPHRQRAARDRFLRHLQTGRQARRAHRRVASAAFKTGSRTMMASVLSPAVKASDESMQER
jgi:hypothetical protein